MSTNESSQYGCVISNQKMLSKLDTASTMQDLLGFPTKPERRPPRTHEQSKSYHYCKLLNEISIFVRDKQGFTDYTVRFIDNPNKVLSEHPESPRCRPAISAVKDYSGFPQIDPAKLHWSHLQAVGEDDSISSTEEEAYIRVATHSGRLLQARPDYISAPGIFVSKIGFWLSLADASQCYSIDLIQWDSPDASPLLYAWMRRVYKPLIDTTITIHDLPMAIPTFTVYSDEYTSYSQCSVLRVGNPFGRRTMVLVHSESDTVIKEQYIRQGRRFEEGPMLTNIHRAGNFPGIVRIRQFGSVKLDGQEITTESDGLTKTKMRVILEDRAGSMMAAKTPKDVLMALYDVLEITRILWRNKKILHRDISANNILVREELREPSNPLAGDLGDMCFSTFLLDQRAPASSSTPFSGGIRPTKYATKALLIDFDMADDQMPGTDMTDGPKSRAGTPIFMARVLREGKHHEGDYLIPAVPQLVDECGIYSQFLSERLDAFPQNQREWLEVPNAPLPENSRHKLRYDAESVFWCLVWWCVHAQPGGMDQPRFDICPHFWDHLTTKKDQRNLIIFKFPEGMLHPSYKDLEPLLEDMAKLLRGDYDFSEDSRRKNDDEYMHEAFQRLIFSFLCNHGERPFVDLEKGPQKREVEKIVRMRPSIWSSSE